MKGVPFVNRRYTKGVPFFVKNGTYKGKGLGGASPYKHLLSASSGLCRLPGGNPYKWPIREGVPFSGVSGILKGRDFTS